MTDRFQDLKERETRQWDSTKGVVDDLLSNGLNGPLGYVQLYELREDEKWLGLIAEGRPEFYRRVDFILERMGEGGLEPEGSITLEAIRGLYDFNTEWDPDTVRRVKDSVDELLAEN
ncbi:MAG: hypothetical protein QF824_00750 [Candidatus Woesearchaeota archaeon]|jgi:hypothetical protein|nr:hypothetical protein [Candidatus Woesearchaeota archaeon]MDP7179783.1 hypothetical protein [Candidatus Woesearchaeota archaeon]|tara:strand:- start:2 stop:352 length:351 start_codon:yes stop_codon:yes gene_type:complete